MRGLFFGAAAVFLLYLLFVKMDANLVTFIVSSGLCFVLSCAGDSNSVLVSSSFCFLLSCTEDSESVEILCTFLFLWE